MTRYVLSSVLALVSFHATASAQASEKASQNHPPTVVLLASPYTLCYGGTVKLVADANDPDGDKLSYRYTIREGRILGKGRKVRWVLGEMGQHRAEVTVSDGREGVASNFAFVTVFELCSCPSLSVEGSFSVGREKRLATFTLSMIGGQPWKKPTYTWIVSRGKTVKGRRSPAVVVDTSDVSDDITATVKIEGLAPECQTSKSLTATIPPALPP